MSFGSGGLCSLRENTKIEIEGVSWAAADPEPLKVEPWLRIYSSKDESADAFISLLGPAWESSVISQEDTVYDDDIAGYEITETCEQLEENKRTQMTDLFFLVTSGPEGAEVPEAYVDYKANGRSYRLIIDYGMIMCGPAISEREPEDGSPGDCQQ
ncbi:hypothetical protein BJH93_11245 [Kocuria polaris]|nr:hypothetical protein [Kocuria polaris]